MTEIKFVDVPEQATPAREAHAVSPPAVSPPAVSPQSDPSWQLEDFSQFRELADDLELAAALQQRSPSVAFPLDPSSSLGQQSAQSVQPSGIEQPSTTAVQQSFPSLDLSPTHPMVDAFEDLLRDIAQARNHSPTQQATQPEPPNAVQQLEALQPLFHTQQLCPSQDAPLAQPAQHSPQFLQAPQTPQTSQTPQETSQTPHASHTPHTSQISQTPHISHAPRASRTPRNPQISHAHNHDAGSSFGQAGRSISGPSLEAKSSQAINSIDHSNDQLDTLIDNILVHLNQAQNPHNDATLPSEGQAPALARQLAKSNRLLQEAMLHLGQQRAQMQHMRAGLRRARVDNRRLMIQVAGLTTLRMGCAEGVWQAQQQQQQQVQWQHQAQLQAQDQHWQQYQVQQQHLYHTQLQVQAQQQLEAQQRHPQRPMPDGRQHSKQKRRRTERLSGDAGCETKRRPSDLSRPRPHITPSQPQTISTQPQITPMGPPLRLSRQPELGQHPQQQQLFQQQQHLQPQQQLQQLLQQQQLLQPQQPPQQREHNSELQQRNEQVQGSQGIEGLIWYGFEGF